MLVALLLPAAVAARIADPLIGVPTGIDGTALVTIAVAAGFVLGVVVDRASDTLLDRWLGAWRMSFAHGALKQTGELLESVGKNPEAFTDAFPEDWMRYCAGKSASEVTADVLTQLRIRIRVARNMTVLMPALTTSVAAALSLRLGHVGIEIWFVPFFHLTALLAMALLAAHKAFKPPRTTDRDFILARSEVRKRRFQKWMWKSPAVGWFTLQLGGTGIVLVRTPDHARVLAVALLIGAALTTLAAWALWRMSRTYFGTLWAYCRFDQPVGLVEALGGNPRPLPSRSAS